MVLSDLDRFDFYARRIRKLEFEQYHSIQPAESALQELRELKGGPIWPNVQSVCCTVRDMPFPLLEDFFTPMLVSLDIIC